MGRLPGTNTVPADKGNDDPLPFIAAAHQYDQPPTTVEECWKYTQDMIYNIYDEMNRKISVLTEELAVNRRKLQESLDREERLRRWLSIMGNDRPSPQCDSPSPAGSADRPGSPAPPPVDEPRIGELRSPFIMSVRNDAHLTNVCISLLRTLAPKVSGRRKKLARWVHVRLVLMHHHVITADSEQRAFGEAIAAAVPGQKAENVRKACVNYDIPKGKYPDWPEGNADKEQCLAVEQELSELFSLLPK